MVNAYPVSPALYIRFFPDVYPQWRYGVPKCISLFRKKKEAQLSGPGAGAQNASRASCRILLHHPRGNGRILSGSGICDPIATLTHPYSRTLRKLLRLRAVCLSRPHRKALKITYSGRLGHYKNFGLKSWAGNRPRVI